MRLKRANIYKFDIFHNQIPVLRLEICFSYYHSYVFASQIVSLIRWALWNSSVSKYMLQSYLPHSTDNVDNFIWIINSLTIFHPST